MKFVGQSFQKLEHEQYKHTDATEHITMPHLRVVIIRPAVLLLCG